MKSASRFLMGFAVLGLTAFGASAQAGFVVTLVSPDDAAGFNNPVIVSDGSALDSAGAVNQIGYIGSVGSSFPVTLTVSTTNSPGDPSGSYLQVTSIVVTNTSSSSKRLFIDVTSTGYNSPSGTGLALVSLFSGNALSVTAGDDANFQSFADPGNNPYGNDIYPNNPSPEPNLGPPSIFTLGAVHTDLQDKPLDTTGSFSTPTMINSFSASTYSLSNYTTLLMSPFSQLNVSGTTVVNPASGSSPEPASLALLGLGGMALLRRRR